MGKGRLSSAKSVPAGKRPLHYPEVRLPSKNPEYKPSEKEEYLSAARQKQICNELEPIKDMDTLEQVLMEDGVAFIEDAIPVDLIDEFLNSVDGFSEINDDSLVSLQDFAIYEGPKDKLCAINWKKNATRNVVKRLLKSLDDRMKSICELSVPMQEECFIRCKGKGFSTVEHCDFFHYKKEIVSLLVKDNSKPIIRCSESVNGCKNMVKSNALECPCGIWAHKTCLPIEYSPKCGEIWTCDKCSNMQFPIYTAWINLNDVDEYSSVLGVIKGSHALKGFQCRYECRKIPRQCDLYKAKWSIKAGTLKKGSLILFNIKLIHAASQNLTDVPRVSIDRRYTLQFQ